MIVSSLAYLMKLFMVQCLSNATGTSESHQRRERLSKEPGGKLDFEDLYTGKSASFLTMVIYGRRNEA